MEKYLAQIILIQINQMKSVVKIIIIKPLKTRKMKRFKITFNYFEGGKKRIGIKILEAYDRDHAIIKTDLYRPLILKVETL